MKEESGKLIPISLDGLEFENDFGELPIGLGHFSKDQGFIVVASLVGAFVGAAIAGLPLAAVVLVAGLNDIRYANKNQEYEPASPEQQEPPAIDVEAQEVKPSALLSSQEPVLHPDQWAKDLMGYPSILIHGAQGAGKTSAAAWLIRERIKTGHQIKMLDPHREHGQWDGLNCIGDGMDYEAINKELKAFTEEIEARYKARAKTPNYNPPKLTLVCDEFTQWAKKCSHSATFFEESLTNIRKINLHVLFISHARTLIGLGGSSGLAATRDAGLLELELEAQVDPVTGEASPKLLGWLKYPGVAMNERQRVAIASWMNGSMDFKLILGSKTQIDVRDQLEKLLSVEPTPGADRPLNPTPELMNQPTDEGCTDLGSSSQFSSEPGSERFTPQNLSKEQVLSLVQNLNAELNQTQIIERLWQVKKGGSCAWKEAREQFKRLTGE